MKYSMEFLCWVDRCFPFRDDFERDLIELDADADDAFFLARSEAVKQGSIVKLYQDYGLKEGSCKDAIDAYLAFMLDKWNSYGKNS